MDYYSLVGDSGTVYGVIRKEGTRVERFDSTVDGDWKFLPSGLKYFNGDNNHATEVSEAQARKLMKQLSE